ncbi:hypothetical protein [Pseudomonas multiresinivorans]|uniref:Uncharacterized protein n=1 Tax=Pseudomonas multiresinivorans TaxID=95301 RepID=A0A7Z3GQQ9_9PSED|nr:hypothetical protein [Pseudomonas multiresinivorans]QJP09151.1 hypothetical protein G4G71_15155 [Pseudomonas multiresinivorans]
MPQLPPDEVPVRRRMRWHWRLLTLKIYILSVFLLACMLGGSAMLFLNTLNETLEPAQRLGSFAAGALILLLCVHILRMGLPPMPWLTRRRSLE